MKIFVAGATGALGRRLVPMLVAGGHEVVGMTRTPGKRGLVRRGQADEWILAHEPPVPPVAEPSENGA